MLTSANTTSLRTESSLVDQLIEQITNAVINHELEPGERLPSEAELAEMYNVGKSSVREAVKVLQALGVIEVRRGDGTFICKEHAGDLFNPVLYQMMIQPSDLDKLYELRRIFEPSASILAVENATEEDIKKIEDRFQKYESLVKDNRQTGKDDVAFHMSIYEATHNPYLIKIGEMILKLLEKSIDSANKTFPEASVSDHKKIFYAIKSKDINSIRKAEEDSFRRWFRSNTSD
ncbi:MAG: FadR family transcriptional regulator [Oscillospiraceae bacterium]|nr:FadR family transcriptional regulator [Oscillospiraceae bacterium]